MKLSDAIRAHQEDEFPAEVAACSMGRLYSWQKAAEDLERARDRWHTVAHVFLACGVGLALAALWLAVHQGPPVPVAPSELSGDPERNVMQLDPDTVITYPNRTIEI